MKKILSLVLLLASFTGVKAQETPLEEVLYEFYDFSFTHRLDFRLGYNIGGTMPLGMPASIRSLNSYSPQLNLQMGVDYERHLNEKWGITFGLRLEHKGMKIDANTKGYHMTMEQGGESIEGLFYGNVVTKASTWSITVPVQADYWFRNDLKVRFGPYIGYNLDKNFKGHAYDGYLRKDTPTGERIELGSTEDSRGEYNFSDDLRTMQWGLAAGIDYYIHNGWGVYGELQCGLSNVFKSSFDTIEQSMYPIYFTIGVMKGF